MTAVMILPQRNPLVLAKEVATRSTISAASATTSSWIPNPKSVVKHAINYPVRNSERSSNSLLARFVEGTSNVVAITRSA
jgi:hypothetical protein